MEIATFQISNLAFFDDYGAQGYLPTISAPTLEEALKWAIEACIKQMNKNTIEGGWGEDDLVGIPGTEMEWYADLSNWHVEAPGEHPGEHISPGRGKLYLLVARDGDEAWYFKLAKIVNGKRRRVGPLPKLSGTVRVGVSPEPHELHTDTSTYDEARE